MNSFTECLKTLQEKCEHKELEILKNGVTVCMCCGKVVLANKVENEKSSIS